MNFRSEGTSEVRFAAYVQGLSSVLGHADRIGPLRDYCTGLILPGERKSVEPMAAKTAPARTAAPRIKHVGRRQACPWRLSSRPNRGSHLSRYGGRARRVCHAASH